MQQQERGVEEVEEDSESVARCGARMVMVLVCLRVGRKCDIKGSSRHDRRCAWRFESSSSVGQARCYAIRELCLASTDEQEWRNEDITAKCSNRLFSHRLHDLIPDILATSTVFHHCP